MAQDTEGLRPFVFANPARIFIKAHIQDPMQPILNVPMLSHGVTEPHAITGQRE
jgi:hypothetical protein